MHSGNIATQSNRTLLAIAIREQVWDGIERRFICRRYMAKIPAVILQQFVGMGDYERTLAIDRASKDLNMSVSDILSELREFENGPAKPPQAKPSSFSAPERKSIFKASENEGEDSPSFLQDTHKYRFTYDPSQAGKKRQEGVEQAILCPHCNAALGIPSTRPIKVTCPSCMMDSTFET